MSHLSPTSIPQSCSAGLIEELHSCSAEQSPTGHKCPEVLQWLCPLGCELRLGPGVCTRERGQVALRWVLSVRQGLGLPQLISFPRVACAVVPFSLAKPGVLAARETLVKALKPLQGVSLGRCWDSAVGSVLSSVFPRWSRAQVMQARAGRPWGQGGRDLLVLVCSFLSP